MKKIYISRARTKQIDSGMCEYRSNIIYTIQSDSLNDMCTPVFSVNNELIPVLIFGIFKNTSSPYFSILEIILSFTC